MRACMKNGLRGNSEVRVGVEEWVWKQDWYMEKGVGDDDNC